VLLVGGDCDDLSIGGSRGYQFSGAAGADHFANRWTDSGIDMIADYSNNEVYLIEIQGIFIGFDPDDDTRTDFVSITSDSTDTTVSLDPGGGAGAPESPCCRTSGSVSR
jgi:hypothetical protein